VGDPPATEMPGSFELHETTAIEQDRDLYQRVVARLTNPARTVPAEEALGSLDEDLE
jgi:hypothetical protein